MGRKEKLFFANYKMIYQRLNHSMKWKSHKYKNIFLRGGQEKMQIMSVVAKDQLLEEMSEELRNCIADNFPSFLYITNVTESKNRSF